MLYAERAQYAPHHHVKECLCTKNPFRSCTMNMYHVKYHRGTQDWEECRICRISCRADPPREDDPLHLFPSSAPIESRAATQPGVYILCMQCDIDGINVDVL